MSAHDNEMLDLFVQESTEHLQTLESDLIALESDPSDAERLNRIFRAVHSIKGTAGFFGFSPIVNLAHVMENLMSVVRAGELVAEPAVVSRLIAGADRLALMIGSPANAGEIPHTDEIAALQEILDQGKKNHPARRRGAQQPIGSGSRGKPPARARRVRDQRGRLPARSSRWPEFFHHPNPARRDRGAWPVHLRFFQRTRLARHGPRCAHERRLPPRPPFRTALAPLVLDPFQHPARVRHPHRCLRPPAFERSLRAPQAAR